VVPVNYSFNAELKTIDIHGYRTAPTKKFRDVAHTSRVTFVVDGPGGGVTIRGRGKAFSDDGQELIRVVPERVVIWA